MKYLFFLLALCMATLVTAQRGEIVRDSAYVEQTLSKYYNVRLTEYENGDLVIEKSLSGSTGTADEAYNATLNRIQQEVITMANDAAYVSHFSRRLSGYINTSTAVKAVVSKSALDTLQARSIAPFLAGTWTIKENGAAARTVVFSVTNGGQMKYKVGTDALKNCTLFGYALRLNAYPVTGSTTDIFLLNNKTWVDLGKNYILKKS